MYLVVRTVGVDEDMSAVVVLLPSRPPTCWVSNGLRNILRSMPTETTAQRFVPKRQDPDPTRYRLQR